VAEAWLLAQEPYLFSQELGVSQKHFISKNGSQSNFSLQHSIDDVENLIKKHEAFEKSAAAQEERFSALERLTTVGNQTIGITHSIVHFAHTRIIVWDSTVSLDLSLGNCFSLTFI
jgi:hypothetical protein